jgi:hypothetical protein
VTKRTTEALSSTQMADLLTETGTPTRPSTLRFLHKHGVYSARKTARGELNYRKSDRPKLAALLKKRRAGRYAALRRGREAAIKARRDAAAE